MDKANMPSLSQFPSSQLRVDADDFVKNLYISPQNDSIAALTHRNTLFVWKTGPDLTLPVEPVEPFRYSHGYYNPVGFPHDIHSA